MTERLWQKGRELMELLALPVGGALIVLGVVRVALSAVRSCRELACDDFGRFWYATGAWLDSGRSLYAPTPASIADDGLLYTNLNLPHTHLLFVPFTYVDRNAGAALWLMAGLLAVALSAYVVAVETGWRPTARWLLVFIWWMPTHVQVVTGQVAWVMLPLIAFAWRWTRRRRWVPAGAALGVAIALKPFLVPLLAWYVWRRWWTAAGSALVTVAAILAGGVLLFGPVAYREWRDVAGLVDWYPRSVNASIWSAVYRLLSENSQFMPLYAMERGHLWIVGGCALLIVIACWRLCRAIADVDRQWSLVLCASLLLSPLGWVYYGVWLLPAMGFRWPGVAATALWLIPTPALFFMQPSPLATILWGSAATWGLILTFVHLARPNDSVAAPTPV